MAKTTVVMTLSFTPETKARLKAWAKQQHTTVSGAITQWIWAQDVKEQPTAGGKEDADND